MTEVDADLSREALARLTIYSDASSAKELVQRMGLEPDEMWDKGDLNQRGKPHTTTAIAYCSTVDREGSPADHLGELVGRVSPLRERLRSEVELGSSVRLKIAVFEDADNMTFALPAELLGSVAQLGLDLEFDLYTV